MGNFFTYVTTNPGKSTLYVGTTNDLYSRMVEHYNERGNFKTFAGRYYCYNLIYFEKYSSPEHAIDREKEIKKWRRSKKVNLVNSRNPSWSFYDIKQL